MHSISLASSAVRTQLGTVNIARKRPLQQPLDDVPTGKLHLGVAEPVLLEALGGVLGVHPAFLLWRPLPALKGITVPFGHEMAAHTYRHVHKLGRVRARVRGAHVEAWGPHAFTGQAHDARARVVDLAHGPLLAIVAAVLDDVLQVQRVPVQPLFGALDHPRQRHVGDLLVLIAAAHVGVHARKPALVQFGCSVTGRLEPQCRSEGRALLVQTQSVEGVQHARG